MRTYQLVFGSTLSLFLPLCTVSAARADVIFQATASASLQVLTPAEPGILEISITPGLSQPATLAQASYPANATTNVMATEWPLPQGISDSVQIYGQADGAPGQPATAIAGAEDEGATLTVTNLTPDPLLYSVFYNVQTQSIAYLTRPDETVIVDALAQVQVDNSAPDGMTQFLLGGQSQVWTITAFAGGSAFSPSTPEPGTLALLGGMGLSSAAFALRRLRRR